MGDLMRSPWILAFLLFSSLAAHGQSKATHKGPGPLYSAELQMDVTDSPRDMEEAITLNPGVQTCLREALLKSGDDFSVSFSGLLDAKGVISGVEVEHPYDSLRGCLTKVLPKVKLGEGASGSFSMEISRVRTTPVKSKTFLLDLNLAKKFQ